MSASTVWLAILLVTVLTVAIKGVGPALAGARALPAPAVRVVVLLSSALLSALVVTSALADGDRLHVGADTAGVAVAVLLAWRRAPVLVVVVAAAVTTAGLRAAGVG